MKNRIYLVCMLIAFVLLLNSCAPATPDPEQSLESTNEAQRSAGTAITTDRIQYCGWQDFVSDGTYVIASMQLMDGPINKYNLTTGRVTVVCLKNECKHLSMCLEEWGDFNCPIPPSSDLYFIHDQKVYYKYNVAYNDPEELKKYGSTIPVRTDYFASYDLTTGERQNILSAVQNDYDQLYTFKLVGDYIYYFRNLAQVDKPTSAEDYALCLCRMKLEEYREEVLFDLAKAFPDHPKNTLPMILAIDNDTAFFVCDNTGSAFCCSLAGENGKYLLNAAQENFWGIYSAYGTFYLDGYIYFTKYVEEPKEALNIYKMDATTGERVLLTEDYVRWLFVSDNSIYYEMAQIMQPTEAQLAEAGAGTSSFTIKEMQHDGSDLHIVGRITSANTSIARPWGAGNKLFLQMRSTDADWYNAIFDVTDGTVTSFGK